MYFIQLLELSLLAGLTVSLWTVRVALMARGRRAAGALVATAEAVTFVTVFARVLESIDSPAKLAAYGIGVGAGTLAGLAIDERTGVQGRGHRRPGEEWHSDREALGVVLADSHPAGGAVDPAPRSCMAAQDSPLPHRVTATAEGVPARRANTQNRLTTPGEVANPCGGCHVTMASAGRSDGLGASAIVEVGEHCCDAAVDVGFVEKSELREDGAAVLLDR